VAIARWAPFAEITPESWDRVLAVNLNSTFHCVQLAPPDMVAARRGRIVTIASWAFQMGSPMHAHYIASEGGVVGLTRAVAGEYARHGITVNTIAPHGIDTPMMRQSLRDLGRSADDFDTSHIPIGRVGTGDRSPPRARSCARKRRATSRGS